MNSHIEVLEKGDLLKDYIENANNTLRLLVTKDCNSKCAYCYEEGICNSTNNQKQELDFDDFKKIILVGKKLGVKRISIAGGEPTLYFDWVKKLIEICKKENLMVYITTNATNEKIINLARDYPGLEFRISLDCSSRKQYKSFRGIDIFDKVIKTLQELAKYKNEIHINRVVTTLDNEWEEFEKMIQMLKEKKLDKENVFLRLIPAYPSKATAQLEVLDYINYLAKFIPELKAQLRQRNMQFMYKFKYKGINVLIRTRGIYSSKCCKTKCTEGIAYTRINPNGIIQPCFGTFLDEKIKHGDSKKEIEKKLIKSRNFLDNLYEKDQNISDKIN